MLIIKNEVNNSERIMKGILETHAYFFSSSPFSLVSNVYQYTFINSVKQIIHNIRIYLTNIIVYLLTLYFKNRKVLSYSVNIEYCVKSLFKLLLEYNIS